MAKKDKIAETLGIRDLEEVNPVVPTQVEPAQEMLPVIDSEDQLPALVTPEAEENLKDIELAKRNIENIINLGDDSVKEMVEIAKQSESPRAFEVVSTLMKTLLDANKDYVDMSTKKRYAREEANPSKNQVTNNNLIVSTADLLKMLKDGSDD
tara:strand:+ start:9529 stop:9987 length:459 start_codon:yes stop_codon:yes gene_type:complete